MAGIRTGTAAGGGGMDPRGRIGKAGEEHAAEFFRACDGVVISQNWRCASGELDLVVLDAAGRLRFVEVKTRTGVGFGAPAEAVTEDKRRRIRTVAREWLSAHPGGWRQVCFDVVAVDLSDSSRPRLELFEEVF